MSKYYLTEAYGELYNPRRADETFYENLRFVDYLMQEEIEEVMESLLWEFMDYGNTLDESHSLIQSVFSDSVILEGVLMELNPYAPAGSKEARQYAKSTTRSKRGAERAAAVTGALKKAKETVGKAATGVGSAVASAARAGKTAAAGAYDRAKGLPGKAMAALKGVVRKGAAAAIKAGRSTERAGKEAEKTIETTTTTSGGGRGVAPSIQTKTKTFGGAKRRAIGGLLKKAGKAVASAIKGKSSGMSRGDYEEKKAGRAAAARSSVGEPFSGSSSGGSTPRRALPAAGQTSGSTQQSPRRAAALAKQSNAAAGRGPGETRVGAPSGTFTTQTKSGETKPTSKTKRKETFKMIQRLNPNAKASQIGEQVDFELLAQYILEDFIKEGYANNYEDAFEILENLSEESILELTEMYLEG